MKKRKPLYPYLLTLIPILAALVLELFKAPSCYAQARPYSQVPTLTVVGNAETRVKPDLAVLEVAVDTTGKSAQEASQLNAQLSQKIAQALKSQIANRGTISAGGYSLIPEFSVKQGNQGSELVGYRVENSITVHTTSLERVGALIDAAIAAGATRISRLTFSINDDGEARKAAISMAARKAQEEAQALADALGVRLKRIVNASVEGRTTPTPLVMSAGVTLAGAGRAATPIESGYVVVPASVSLTYEIER